VVLGLVFAVGVDRADRRLKEYSDFEREYRLPILALIPRVGKTWRVDSRDGNGVVGFVQNYSPTLEAYRLLRSNLQYFELGKGLRSILITSGLPQESKTVTVINLALSLALSGARVVLVDTDLRNPLMHSYLGLNNDVGLSSVLAGSITVKDATKVVETAKFLPSHGRDILASGDREPHLHKDLLCLTSGPIPPNPAELLASPRMSEILKALSSLADHVLIDSAPVLPVADTLSIAPRVDGVIIVCRAKTATSDNAREVRSTLERVGARLVGLVIAGVKVSSSHGYQHGYYQRRDS
jgi:capsular exopolysaccharide synthesis family protein